MLGAQITLGNVTQPKLHNQGYAAKVTQPRLRCPVYTEEVKLAKITLPRLHNQGYTAVVTLPMSRSQGVTAEIKLETVFYSRT